jgi:hypothetical protein
LGDTLGFSKFHETAYYLCEASIVLEDILQDKNIANLDAGIIAHAKQFSETINAYLKGAPFDGASVKDNKDDWKL